MHGQGRHGRIVGAVAALAALAATATSGDARACGGCFSPPTQSGTVVTDHRMIFAVSPAQTTLYDEIEYQGNPSDFAWVLPIHGTVTVGLSSDALFGALDRTTQTTIVAPPRPVCQTCGCENFGAAAPVAGAVASDAGAVTVLGQQVVGPYDTVQLQSSDPNALTAWLDANHYAVPSNVAPVIAAYVNEGFDFLAIRLSPGQGVSAMRPVSVTSPGSALTLPLRMVAAGTGATVGITLWVVGQGRYEPKNFLDFVISPSELTWDFFQSISNYTTLRAAKEQGLNDAAWQIESSLDISPYSVESEVLADSASVDYLPIAATDGGAFDGGATVAQTPEQVRQQDLQVLFASGPGTVRITRMRADLSQAALATDLVLQAAADQTAISNIYQVTKSVNAPQCPPYDAATCQATCAAETGSSSSSGSGSSSGVGTGGGGVQGTGSSSGSGNALGPAPATSTSSCAMGPAGAPGGDVALSLVGLVGIALVRSRKKTR
jgi:uncharacterized membrane protein YgcG